MHSERASASSSNSDAACLGAVDEGRTLLSYTGDIQHREVYASIQGKGTRAFSACVSGCDASQQL